ncbi:MAG: GNAT family N-acetyltransferase, partial [Pseudomonadota bacterium]
DGDMDYERRYLSAYRDSAAAIVVAPYDGDRMVGASTGLPLEDHDDDFAAPLAELGLTAVDVFYCAESVLLSAYRGRGLGHVFFDRREAQARALGRARSMFCAVNRPADHPARPADYRPLDGFWAKRGYAPLDGVSVSYGWRDLGETKETTKTMQVWMKTL